MKYLYWFIGGTVFGLLFAYAHVYMGYKLDIPLYGILILAGKFIACTGRGCLPYLWGAMALSALIWGAVALIIGLIATRMRANTSYTSADRTDPGV